MRIDTASHLITESNQQPTTLDLSVGEFKELRVIQIEPQDAFETIFVALRLQPEPVVLLLPEQSQAFSDPAHFAQIRQVRPHKDVSFLIPPRRIAVLGNYARHYGFAFASSLQEASQSLMIGEREQAGASQKGREVHGEPMTDTSSTAREEVAEDEQEGYDQHTICTPWSPLSTRSPQKHSISRHRGFIAALVALLVIAGAVLLPALFSAQPELTDTAESAAPTGTSVGQIAFTSSGQLDPTSAQGLNDTITVSLHNLSTPAMGQSDYAWLMPDPTDDTTKPLLLGRLQVTGGKAQFTSINPDHQDLLAVYSGFEVVAQPSNRMPTTTSLDPRAVQCAGSIPDLPTPGDELRYSLLDHLRHLLAKDPTLQEIGLQGGLDIWLYRNAEKILEWSSAARDSWASGQKSDLDLVHRHMIRVVDYLDGAAYVNTTGDVPAGSPLLVDPQAGWIGLLEISQTQALALPAYLTHIDIHLQGFMYAPGHTEAQKQLALKIENALKLVTSLMQQIHQDAAKLVKMNDAQLKSSAALALLNDMLTNATNAYAGQFDATTGGNINGVVWIHNEMQGLAALPVTVTSAHTQ